MAGGVYMYLHFGRNELICFISESLSGITFGSFLPNENICKHHLKYENEMLYAQNIVFDIIYIYFSGILLA